MVNGLAAQNTEAYSEDEGNASNTVYFELLGKGLYYSINYEAQIFHFDKFSAGFSIGMGIYAGMTDIEKSRDFTMPFELQAMYHLNEEHHIQFGFGTTFWKYKINDIEISNANINQQPVAPTLKTIKEWFGHINIGYRHQKPEGGLIYHAGITPLWFASTYNSAFTKKANGQLSINLGVGYSF